MIEIVAALIGGVFLLGGAVITARWTRSRSTNNPPLTPSQPTGNASGAGTTPDTGRPSQHAESTDAPPAAPNGARAGGVTVNGQFIETNNGTVSQTNYRDGKR
jgi:hypothetical protein